MFPPGERAAAYFGILTDQSAQPLVSSSIEPFVAWQSGEELSNAFDQGLEAVQLLHTEYADLLSRLRASREVRTDRSRVAFSLGTVFIHKKFGYKGMHIASPCGPPANAMSVFHELMTSQHGFVHCDKYFLSCAQVLFMDGTRSVRGTPLGLQQCTPTPRSHSIMSFLTKVLDHRLGMGSLFASVVCAAYLL